MADPPPMATTPSQPFSRNIADPAATLPAVGLDLTSENRTGASSTSVRDACAAPTIGVAAKPAYLYDRTKRDRRATYKLLQRHHEHVWKSAVTVFGFEQVLRSTQTPQMQAHEAQLHTCWNELTADIRAKSGARFHAID